MRIDIVSAVPKLFNGAFSDSILKRAIENKHVEIHIHNIRDYSTHKQKSIDDYQYGGGAGMVLMVEPLDALIGELKQQRAYDHIIYLTPDAALFNQEKANIYSMKQNIMLLCGHYKGIDQRIRDLHVTDEISIGDYVLSGGELAACVVSDAIIRLIPGVLNDISSALSDSHQDGLLAPPVYTRPSEYKGLKVPEVLLGGNAKEIEKWREEKSLERTKKVRPDLYSDD